MLSALFWFSYLKKEKKPGSHDSPIFASFIATMTGVHHHTQLFIVEMGVSLTFLPGLALNHHPPDLRLLSS
jgi:hypothetical protein